MRRRPTTETIRRPAGVYWMAVLLVGALWVGCSGNSSGSSDAGAPCTTNADCPDGRCVAGGCDAAETTDARGSARSGELPPLPSLPSRDDRDATSPEEDATAVDDGGFLADCNSNEACDSGYCIHTRQGRVCTTRCQQDQDCALAAGWRCRTVGAGGVDIEELCYPDEDDLCEPCTFDDECGEVDDRCVRLDDGRFCAMSCTGGALCPIGYSCELIDDDLEQCIPVERLCGPCRGADLSTDVLHCGGCDNVCVYRNGVPACESGRCVGAGCDRGFRDCDGDPSTGCETAIFDDPTHCGACDTACTETSEGTVRCAAGECVPTACPAGRANCDLDSGSGCETLLESDPAHCGACGATCAPGVLCVQGQCGCSPGEVLCDGECQPANACGGCGPLPGEPGTRCDDCGTWTCDGDTTVCTGQVDRLTDTRHCGTCDNACRPDQTCTAGLCGCPDGRIACAGACVLPNACGGCGPLPGEPDTPCANCGTWACSEGTAVCSLQVNRDTDPAHCGGCGIVCRSDQICGGGTCRCAAEQIACGGRCVAPSPCGGCDARDRAIGDDCDDCGQWSCAPDSTAWVCTGQVDRLTDPANCGTCGNACEGGTICQEGSCRCPVGEVDCGGTCVPERVDLLGQDFEGGIAPWTTEVQRSSLGPWLITEEQAFDGTQSAWVRGATDAVSDHRLLSPEVMLPSAAESPELEFRMRHDISRASTSCFDGGTLDVSTDGGSSWTVIPSARLSAPYDAVMNSGFSNPRPGQSAWCGTRTHWTRVRVDISPWAGQSVRFRWRFTTDAAGTPREGWYVDAVVVTRDGCPPTATGE